MGTKGSTTVAPPPVERRAIHAREFAERYGLSLKLVLREIDRGELRTIPVGPHDMILPDAEEDWLKAKVESRNPRVHRAVAGLCALGIEPRVIAATVGTSIAVAELWVTGEKRPSGKREELLWELLRSAYDHGVTLLDMDLEKQSRPPEEILNIVAALRAAATLLTDAGFEIPKGCKV